MRHVNSDGLNEADEMNLYLPNPQLDSPFGYADLEWLYRQQTSTAARWFLAWRSSHRSASETLSTASAGAGLSRWIVGT